VALGKMHAISAEVRAEPEALDRFAVSKLPLASRGSIFVGAGDSYAAALAGFYSSRGRCLALDPYSLAGNPEIAEGLEVFFISASGKTASNIAAARRVAGTARRTTVLTADPSSTLAKLTDRTVRIPMAYVPRTPGMLSFCLSLLAVLKIADVQGPCDFQRAFSLAKRDRRLITSDAGTTYFLGNGLAYPAALYAAAKDYEFLGARAHAELLEEFSHLELFSIGRKDVVNIFSCFDPLGMAPRLAKSLGGAGYRARVVPERGGTKIEQLFHAVFVVQLAVIERAARSGLSEPNFLSSGERLKVSDSMIY
jgi:glutamine---fructose-6-phosphate transaminase (isomerizing)